MSFMVFSFLAALQAPVGDLIRDLGSDDPGAREQAVQDLIKVGEPSLPDLRAALLSADAEVRARAACAIEAVEWAVSERKLAGFLRKFVRSDLEHREIPDARGWLGQVRIYRLKTEGSGLLLALRKDGQAILSNPFSEGAQEFVVALLKDVRVASDEDRLQAGRLCLAVLDQFNFSPGASPAAIAAHWTLELREYVDRPNGVGFGGFWSKNPEFGVGFDAEGRIRSVHFCYMD